jgi:hypothetical protein
MAKTDKSGLAKRALPDKSTEPRTVPIVTAKVPTTPSMGNQGSIATHDPTRTLSNDPTNDLGRRTCCPSRRPDKGLPTHHNEQQHVSASPVNASKPNDARLPTIVQGHGQERDPVPTHAALKPMGTVTDRHNLPTTRTIGDRNKLEKIRVDTKSCKPQIAL